MRNAKDIRILVDAGHYGKRNQSTVIAEYYESIRMWDLHLLLVDELRKIGFIVDTTREEQGKDLAVTERGKMAKDYDLVISLHSNATDNEEKDRVAVYYQVQTGEQFEIDSKAFAKFIAPILNKAMECSGDWKTEARKSDYDRDKDGYRDNYYGFLRGAADVKCTAILIEHSYHTNKRATEWLLNDDNLKLLASVEAEAIAEFFEVDVPFIAGDVDGDGKITQYDYILAKRIFFGTYKPTEEEAKRADVDGDGKVSQYDYIAIKRKFFGTLD